MVSKAFCTREHLIPSNKNRDVNHSAALIFHFHIILLAISMYIILLFM